MPRAFIIRPFGSKKDSGGTEIDFERTDKELIAPALTLAGVSGGTTGEIVEAGNIREDMFGLILEADLVVCDIMILNANVFYELGIRHALRKKSTVLIRGVPTQDSTPFDLLTDRYLPYDIADPGRAKGALVAAITASLKSHRETDSPIFQMLPTLPEVDFHSMQVAPADFREEVERARAARSKGWLRLVAEDVRDRRFRWVGLKLVGQAQWDLEDYDAATATWELIREAFPDDVDANLALTNVYERQYRRVTRNLQILERSNQAIERVLKNEDTPRRQRAEALALQGRNQKTQWRLKFSELATVEQRRAAAMNSALMQSYESYRTAFLYDLNNFWAGLAAVQMGTILVDLSKEAFWPDPFDSDLDAETYRTRLQTEVPRLVATVRVSIDANIKRLDRESSDRVWADISGADARFLDPDARERRIVEAYVAAIPSDRPFFWGAARGQLELFASLGVKAALAQNVIQTVSARMPAPRQEPDTQRVHLIMFAGHRIDAADRETPRFPAAKGPQAKELLRQRLASVLNPEETFVGLASAAPGADILAHELCSELGLNSTVCLPMPANEYARHAFGALDAWRGRYLDIMEKRKDSVLELSDMDGLPRWLHGSNTNPWERGSRWVLQIARAWGASRITLIALWDQRVDAHAPRGGTTHMVQLARDAGNIRIEVVDANQLVG